MFCWTVCWTDKLKGLLFNNVKKSLDFGKMKSDFLKSGWSIGLSWAEALELTVHHDSQPVTESLTLLHTDNNTHDIITNLKFSFLK